MSWFRKKASEVSAASPDAAREETPTVEPLTQAEVDWVRSSIAGLAEQDVRVRDVDDLGRHYDELLTAWLRVREADRPDPTTIVNQIGLALGQYLVDHAGLEWAVATDANGPEIALLRPGAEVLLYPTDMVATRWLEHETHVLPALARETLEAVASDPTATR